jgi:acetyl-CoA carboxylase carboxyltransferase component
MGPIINLFVTPARPIATEGDGSEAAFILTRADRTDSLRYAFVPVRAEGHRFLGDIFSAFGCSVFYAQVDERQAGGGFDRAAAEGLITGLIDCDGRRVGVVWSDFRVRAASYSRSNARRFTAFLKYLREQPESIPLVYIVNSAGLSLMEGRTAFSDVFAMWPELLRYADSHLTLTCASGRCLGLAPILYGLGHYRVAVADSTQINLTGPEVIRLFFGEGFDYDRHAAAERCLQKHDLVHEIVPSVFSALKLFRSITGSGEWPEASGQQQVDPRMTGLLDAIGADGLREIVPGWTRRLRLFVAERRGERYGLFLSPPGQCNNMIDVRTLQKYAAGLDLFHAMRLPIVSVLDSPGIDPRFEEMDAGLIRQIVAVGDRIIRYPYGKLGVVAGRCFGGASTLAFPKVFGGSRAVALPDAQFGVMHERIVAQVLSGSPRLLAQWQQVAAAQGTGFEDLLAEGSLDATIAASDLPREIDHFLQAATSQGGITNLPTTNGRAAGRPQKTPRRGGTLQA